MDTGEASHDYDRPAAPGAGDTRLGGSGLRGGAVALPGTIFRAARKVCLKTFSYGSFLLKLP